MVKDLGKYIFPPSVTAGIVPHIIFKLLNIIPWLVSLVTKDIRFVIRFLVTNLNNFTGNQASGTINFTPNLVCEFGNFTVTENNKVIEQPCRTYFKNIFLAEGRPDFLHGTAKSKPIIDMYSKNKFRIFIPPEIPTGNTIYYYILGIV